MNAPAQPPLNVDVDALYAAYDHVDPPIGPDNTPCAYHEQLRDAAVATKQFVGWSEHHGGFWVVAGFPECDKVIKDVETFSSAGVIFPKYAVTEPLMLAEQDEPEHMRNRRLVNLSFMPRSVINYGDAVKKAVHELIDGFIEQGHADVGRILADPVPAIVTALIMGLPAEHGPLFDRWTTACTHEFLRDPASAQPKIAEMYAYFEEMIATRKKNPGGTDVLSQVIDSEINGDRLSHTELLGFSTVLLIGGIENSAKLIGSALWRLGWDVELRRRLIRQPEKMALAVDEFLRYYSPGTIGRIVTKDLQFEGKSFQKGQQVMLALPVANRDPREFANPDAFVFDRPNNRHLALGTGLHVCLGGHLIRMEARVVLSEFLSRVPEYHIEYGKPMVWTTGQVAGMARVPIAFAPGARRGTERAPGVAAWLAHAVRP